MRTIRTTDNGKIQTVFNGEQEGDGWTKVPESEYVHPRDTPKGYVQTRYLKADSDLSFDHGTEYIGTIRRAIVGIVAPNTIPNDGTEIEITLTTEAEDIITSDLTIDDMSETVDIDVERTETITTTLDAGETITISVGGGGVEPAAVDIEVVSA